MMTQLLCNYLYTCSASPSRHNSYSMSQCCHDAPLVPPKLWRGDTGQTGAWSQLVQSPLLWEHRHQPPQLHCHHILTSTVTHLHHRISSLLSLGADISALMSYAARLPLLRCHYWCITGVSTWDWSPQCSSGVLPGPRAGPDCAVVVACTVQYRAVHHRTGRLLAD